MPVIRLLKKNEKGQALILSYVVIIFVIMILAVLFNLAISDSLLYQRDENRIRAESLAQAGANFAIDELAKDLYAFPGNYDAYVTGATLGYKCPLFVPINICQPTNPVVQLEDNIPANHNTDLAIPDPGCDPADLSAWCHPNQNEGFRVRIVRNRNNPDFVKDVPGKVYLREYSPVYPQGVGYLGWGFLQYIIESTGYVWDRSRDAPDSGLEAKKVKNFAIVQTKVNFLYFPHPLKWTINEGGTPPPADDKWETAETDLANRTSAGWVYNPTVPNGPRGLGNGIISGSNPPIWFTGIHDDPNPATYPYGGQVIKPFLPPGFYNVNLTLNYDASAVYDSIVVNMGGRSVVIDKADMPPSTIADNTIRYYVYPNIDADGPHYPIDFAVQYGNDKFDNGDIPQEFCSPDIPTGYWNDADHDWGPLCSYSPHIRPFEYEPGIPGSGQSIYARYTYGAFFSSESDPDYTKNNSVLAHDIFCTPYSLPNPPRQCPDDCNGVPCFKTRRDFAGDLYIGPFCTYNQSCITSTNVPIRIIELTRSRGHGDFLFGPAPGTGIVTDPGPPVTYRQMRAEEYTWNKPYIEVYSVERVNIGPFE